MQDKDVVVRVSQVSKTFKLPHEKQSSLKGLFLSSFRPQRYELQKAVRRVSFDVKKGDFFGVIGRNGSGKSTLLKLIAGIYKPDKGSIEVKGLLTPFIELGVGFNPDLSGRDNVFLNGALFGKSRREMEALYGEIVHFAELEQFMDQKLKNYSSGMQVRLAFSIATQVQSDILLLDEVLAVGDVLFQQKCFNYFHQLKKQGQTVLFVSHDTNALRQYCNKGVLLENGKIVSAGEIDLVLNDYLDIVSNHEATTSDAPRRGERTKRHGTGKARIQKVLISTEHGKQKSLFTDDDDHIIVEASYIAHAPLETPVYGIVIEDAAGVKVFGSNNLWSMQESHNLSKGATQTVTWTIPNIFNTGEYSITAAVADFSGKETFDSVDNIASFRVRKKITSSALINPPHQLQISKPSKS